MRGLCVLSPMEELEGWYSAAAHRQLVQSSADSNINMLRVWGGGVYLPQVWYDACDELGVLVFHDVRASDQISPPSSSLSVYVCIIGTSLILVYVTWSCFDLSVCLVHADDVRPARPRANCRYHTRGRA